MRRLFFAIVLLVPAVALGSDPPVTLAWEAEAGCPTRESVLASVTRLLGDTSSEGDAHVDARGVIERTKDGKLRLRLETRVAGAAPGVRTVTAEQCAPLGDAAALIVAMTVNPARVTMPAVNAGSGTGDAGAGASVIAPASASASAIAPAPAPAPAIASASAPAALPAPAPAPAPESPPTAPTPRIHFLASVGPLLDTSTTPTTTFAPSLTLGLAHRHLFLEATAALAPSAAYAPSSGALRASFAWQSFGAHAGVRFSFGALSPFAFVGVDVTHVRARGEAGIATPAEHSTTRTAATLGGGVRVVAIGPLGIRLDAELLVPRTRPRYVVETTGTPVEVYASPAVTGRARISLEFVW